MFNGPRVSTGEKKRFWGWVVVAIAQQCELLNITEMVSFTLGIFYHNFFKVVQGTCVTAESRVRRPCELC